MVIYCMGDILEKRKFFRSKTENSEISVDNEDVLHTFSLGGTTYCVIGSNPFADMSVSDFVAYSRSLISNLPVRGRYVKRLLNVCGYCLSANKKLGKLDRVSLRSVLLASKIENGVKTLFVNCDGLEFTSFYKRQLNRLVAKISKRFDVFLSVSDMRFVPVKANIQIFKDNNIVNETSTSPLTWCQIRTRAENKMAKLFTIKKITECK